MSINLVTPAINFRFENTKINVELTEIENEAITNIQDQGIDILIDLGNTFSVASTDR